MLKTLIVAASKCRARYITEAIQKICNIYVASGPDGNGLESSKPLEPKEWPPVWL